MYVKLIYQQRIFFLAFILFLPSCATIFSGTTQKVKIRSNPSNAKVYVNEKDSGILTNGKITVRRAVARSAYNATNEQSYRFVKEGYEDLYIRDKRTVNGWALAFDMLFPPALLVDFINGSIFKYQRKINAELSRTQEIIEEEPILSTADTEEQIETIIEAPEIEIKEEREVNIFTEDKVDKEIPIRPISNENAIAILIGNENYTSPDINNVEYATEDVATMKEYLIKTFGFREGNILVVNNANLADFNRIFGNKINHQARLYNLVKPAVSDVFIYYSGHGAPTLEKQEAYLVPVECQDVSLLEFEGYALNTLFQNLAQIPYKSLTLVLDACFSGNSHNSVLIQNASPIYIPARLQLLNKENTVVFASNSGEQIASWYPEKKHTLFTYYFLEYIRNKYKTNKSSNEIAINEMSMYLSEKVSYQARLLYNRTQTPVIYGDQSKWLLK